MGAYYGTKTALTALQKALPSVYVTPEEELTVDEQLQTSLLVSKFPINEKVPAISIKDYAINDLSDGYKGEIQLDSANRYFHFWENEKRSDAPRALVFQGSYMNGYGGKYFGNAFSEYVAVHDYQNVLNFPYYMNIFQPECVVFEVAEYTVNNGYFNFEKMQALQVNPLLEGLSSSEAEQVLSLNAWSAECGEMLTTIQVECEASGYAWLQMQKSYDMQRTESGYQATVLTSEYDLYKDSIEIRFLAKA